jgi:hypothetical protein
MEGSKRKHSSSSSSSSKSRKQHHKNKDLSLKSPKLKFNNKEQSPIHDKLAIYNTPRTVNYTKIEKGSSEKKAEGSSQKFSNAMIKLYEKEKKMKVE